MTQHSERWDEFMAEASCTKRTGTSCTHTSKTRAALSMQRLLRIGQVKHLGNSCHSHHYHHQHYHKQKVRRVLQINPARFTVYSLPHDTYTTSQMLPRFQCLFFIIYLLAMLGRPFGRWTFSSCCELASLVAKQRLEGTGVCSSCSMQA